MAVTLSTTKKLQQGNPSWSASFLKSKGSLIVVPSKLGALAGFLSKKSIQKYQQRPSEEMVIDGSCDCQLIT